MENNKDVTITAHPGPQTSFLSTSAQITIFGGSAGGGKSHGILLDALRNTNSPDYRAIIFRRQAVEFNKPGSIAQASKTLYPLMGATFYSSVRKWIFPSGAEIHFMGLDDERDIEALRGLAVDRIYFDELTTFDDPLYFWYPQTRIRSTSGRPGKCKATTNPQASGFVKDMIAWYLDPDTGQAIAERSGVIRYFIRSIEEDSDDLIWFDSYEEGYKHCTEVLGLEDDEIAITSFVFIRSSLEDNPSLGPEYKKRLMSMPAKQRAELLGGSWNYDATSGTYFKRHWVEEISRHQVPKMKRVVRAWDLASTPQGKGKGASNPDWTVGMKVGLSEDGYYYILDVIRFRDTIGGVKRAMLRTAIADGTGVTVVIPLDPGGHGKHAFQDHVKNLAGFYVKKAKTEKSKLERFLPFASAAEHGLVKIVEADWTTTLTTELEGFVGDGKKKDD